MADGWTLAELAERLGATLTGDGSGRVTRVRRPGRQVESHVVVRAGARRQSTELDDFVSARWGLHVRWWGRTLYIPNRHEAWPIHAAELLALDDGLLASVGLLEVAARPPDHVAFSPGVRTEFGLPGAASRPRGS